MEIDINVILQKALDFAVRFIKELITAPQIIWEWSQKSTLNRVIMFAAAAAAVVLLIAAVISTIRGLVKWNKFSLSFFWFVVLLICVGMWFARGQIVARQLPEAETVSLGDGEALVYGQYSLARGIAETDPEYNVLPEWFLADDTISLRVAGDTILQLTGLQPLLEERTFQWDGLICSDEVTHLEGQCWTSSEDGKRICAKLYVFAYPDARMSEEAWYLDPGAKGEAETYHMGCWTVDADGSFHKTSVHAEFEILENTGDQITGVVKTSWMDDSMVFVARQMGEDLVVAFSKAFSRDARENGGSSDKHFSPETDLQERAYLLEPLTALFDGRIRLFSDLTEEQLTMLLPDRIEELPVGLSLNTKRFSIPCRELLSMDSMDLPWDDDYYAAALRFRGIAPDGEECVYTLFNGGLIYKWNATGYYESPEKKWRRAYEDKQATVDADMSEWIGVKAVCYQDGWLIFVGNNNNSGTDKQFYYLMMEPVRR